MGSSASLDRSPKKNWVENSGGLPPYIREIARSVEKTGKTLEQAIAIAVSRIKVWAAGGDGVTPKTQAKASAALAAWTALKAKNKARGAKNVGKAALSWVYEVEQAADQVALSALERRAIVLSVESEQPDFGLVALAHVLNATAPR